MNTFVTHPSVRIRGTENAYTPTQCFDVTCTNKTPHMHCPFCVKSDCYQDPVILKAHYRVKHVDKGIEFAGLKIVRCCDHCDIVGVIKGEKKFKGAHWHCYKCRNGFNRRDEAVKHYKTHFRNPQTTFQIQIAQEVTQPVQYNDNTLVVSEHEAVTIHPALTEAVTCMASSVDEHGIITGNSSTTLSQNKSGDGTLHVSVAANETVEASGGQTIMIIQEDPLDASTVDDEHYTTQIITSEDVSMLEEKSDMDKRIEQLHEKCQQLEMDKLQLEEQLKGEIQQLKQQLQDQQDEITAYQKREQELMAQLSIPLDKGIQDLLHSLEEQHRDLLRQQLAFVRRTYLLQQSLNQTGTNSTIRVQTPSISPDNQIIVIENEGYSNNNNSSVDQLPENLTDNNIIITSEEHEDIQVSISESEGKVLDENMDPVRIVQMDTVDLQRVRQNSENSVNKDLEEECMVDDDETLVITSTESVVTDESIANSINSDLTANSSIDSRKKSDFDKEPPPKRKRRM